jgi:membrane-associated phospholipid phosphatase
MTESLSKIISAIFQPLLMPTYVIICILFDDCLSDIDSWYKWFVVGVVFGMSAFVPILSIFVMKSLGIVSNIQLNNQRERTLPYCVTFLCYTATIYILHISLFPDYIVNIFIGSAISIALLTVINKLFTKISAHMCGIGGGIAALLVVQKMEYSETNYFFILISISFLIAGLIGSSRLKLKAHTPIQILLGFLLGIFSVYQFALF